ncbi:hypothetical protein [Helicobacter sp. MIT 05-5294]|uniref:hypothetical protein n=1 Tax=Helicobacter sp. MIT 05-5294 TaxID=1548150 RepID=UPI00051FB7FB|nr:hypothetical protein [Helicobacter sp. MIT 05-5294]TLD88147.1 hypothetical protein LS69_002490 [Helicobacter sp. MIT 05-5294]
MKSLPNSFKSGRLVPIFFLFLCVFSLVMVVVLGGKRAQNAKNIEEISRFEIFDFEYYRIGMQGVSIVAFGKKGRENPQQINELEHFNVSNFTFASQENTKGMEESLQSSFALYDNQEIFFPQGVNYQRDKTEFWSQKARYNPDKKELKGAGEFIILDENYKIRGQDITYIGDKVYAQNIYGILRTNP